jgi:hypothetical protein
VRCGVARRTAARCRQQLQPQGDQGAASAYHPQSCVPPGRFADESPVRPPAAPRRYLLSPMHALLSAWPALAYLLPALVLVSAIYFLARGDRRAFAHLLALLACFLIGALLMEFFIFMAARMARSGSREAVLGAGTRQLLETMANPRSITAPPLSLAAVAAYSVLASYLWLLVTWGLHLRGKPAGGAGKKKAAKRPPRKPARA